MKPTVLLICLASLIGLLGTTELKSDEQGKGTTQSKSDASDKFTGKEAGQVRDDNGLKMKMVWCPPGEFKMGSPPSEPNRAEDENQQRVSLTNGYWLGKCEVTQAEWKQVMGTEPWQKKDHLKEGADYPAMYISWNDAVDFCRKMTEQERQAGRLPEDSEYMLPTEAQWERGCRALTETMFSFGNDASKLRDYAWYDRNTWRAGEEYAHRVGQKKPNPWGLHDMHGNVWEWCRDAYAETLPGGLDPEVKADEEKKASAFVRRGGGWVQGAGHCRSGMRLKAQPDTRQDYLGFRTALSFVR